MAGSNVTKKLKVAAYCRVSSKYESQKSSIEAQKNYYENYIREQTGYLQVYMWIMAAEEGLRKEQCSRQ